MCYIQAKPKKFTGHRGQKQEDGWIHGMTERAANRQVNILIFGWS